MAARQTKSLNSLKGLEGLRGGWEGEENNILSFNALLFSLVQVSSPKPKPWTKAEHYLNSLWTTHPPTKNFLGFSKIRVIVIRGDLNFNPKTYPS